MRLLGVAKHITHNNHFQKRLGLSVTWFTQRKGHYTLTLLFLAVVLSLSLFRSFAYAAMTLQEPVQACVIKREVRLSREVRAQAARCLGWQPDKASTLCYGYYKPSKISPLPEGQIQIKADEASLFSQGRSRLKGRVEVRESNRVVNAQTAYVYRDAKSNQVKKIELLGNVRYLEPDRMMTAKKVTLFPQTNAGQIEDVIYRFHTDKAGAVLPAWGRASLIERFPNRDFLLRKATYTTCAPQDNAWRLEASQIHLDNAKSRGVAKNAVLSIHDVPVLYTPYLSFPTSKERKSGFLMPMYGYSNIGGFDVGFPYYLNLAPNYDATFIPHIYTLRGLMVGGNFRYLTSKSEGGFSGNVLPDDRAFARFLQDNDELYPSLQGNSNNRWWINFEDVTRFNPNLQMKLKYQQVSDDYYLQDFDTNLADTTRNQLLQEGEMTYTTDHWLFGGLLKRYQTLHPVNQTLVADVYQRLPQLRAQGTYYDLPYHANFNVLGQFDNFNWPGDEETAPLGQGPRFHLNPVLSFPQATTWGYVNPTLELVQNNYNVLYPEGIPNQSFNRTIPRYSVDGGLYFDRFFKFNGQRYTQTLEPRAYYLYVPYHDQSQIPAYDADYMIFSHAQLFRNNRFSGYDRIGDGNQLTYGLATRFLSEATGKEKASIHVGQIRYFANRRVMLCYDREGDCIDNPLILGYVSPLSDYSPIASKAFYELNQVSNLTGGYVWDVYTKATNNAFVAFNYQPDFNKIVTFGYSYLVNGNLGVKAYSGLQDAALNQATFAYAWPLNDHWSTLGVYNYNLSKGYNMLTFVGLQYDSCCWAFRIIGGQTFKSLSPTNFLPEYNNNVYVQILLKGLGSAANEDPTSTITSYLPGYVDLFKR